MRRDDDYEVCGVLCGSFCVRDEELQIYLLKCVAGVNQRRNTEQKGFLLTAD